jgi:hypothetical protein
MTWAEFKAQMEAAGVKDDTEVDYIDIHGGDRDLEIRFHENADGTSVSVLD